MGCSYQFCQCHEARPSCTEEDIQGGIKKRELDELRKYYTEAKGYDVNLMYECDCWKLYKTNKIV